MNPVPPAVYCALIKYASDYNAFIIFYKSIPLFKRTLQLKTKREDQTAGL